MMCGSLMREPVPGPGWSASSPLEGKVALVTGGSRGIGAAVCLALAEAGADVMLSYLKSRDDAEAVAARIGALGRRAVTFRADQSVPREMRALVRAAVGQLGRLDILVNNAGCFVTGHLDDPDCDLALLDRQLTVNLGGAIAAIRAAAKLLPRGGRIISIGAAIADRVGAAGMADYAAANAALAGYSRGAARDLGPAGITVNLVQAGPVDTAMNPADGAFAPVEIAGNALGRYGRPEEIAAGVVFLAGASASFVTGSVLTIDGGTNA